MVYFTGDIHGSPWDIEDFCLRMELTEKDIIVILGDVGANYHGGRQDDLMKSVLAGLRPTIFCIHGNHEQRPANIAGYELRDLCGGQVWVQEKYPNLLFAKAGRDIYDCYIHFEGITDEQIDNMRYRKFDSAITYIGTFKTPSMQIINVSKREQNKFESNCS